MGIGFFFTTTSFDRLSRQNHQYSTSMSYEHKWSKKRSALALFFCPHPIARGPFVHWFKLGSMRHFLLPIPIRPTYLTSHKAVPHRAASYTHRWWAQFLHWIQLPSFDLFSLLTYLTLHFGPLIININLCWKNFFFTSWLGWQVYVFHFFFWSNCSKLIWYT